MFYTPHSSNNRATAVHSCNSPIWIIHCIPNKSYFYLLPFYHNYTIVPCKLQNYIWKKKCFCLLPFCCIHATVSYEFQITFKIQFLSSADLLQLYNSSIWIINCIPNKIYFCFLWNLLLTKILKVSFIFEVELDMYCVFLLQDLFLKSYNRNFALKCRNDEFF
jgi:hypothetical protein